MEESKNKCEFCGHIFSTKTVLANHKVRAKYCIEIQKSLQIKDIKEDFIECLHCKKSFSSDNMKRHEENCKIKKEKNVNEIKNEVCGLKNELVEKDKIIIEKDKQILILQKENEIYKEKLEKLENTIAKIAAKPRTSTTNNTTNNQRYSQIIQNLSPITQQNLDELPSKLEERHISQGTQGYVVFAQENFKDKILCTDLTRRKIIFKDEKNNIITDVNGKQFTYKLFKSINDVRADLVEIRKNKAKESDKIKAILYYHDENTAFEKFLNREEESPFSNKFISDLSSKFYIKNLPNQNSELKQIELDENEIEYLILSDA